MLHKAGLISFLLFSLASASKLSIKDGRVQISSGNNTELRTEEFTQNTQPSGLVLGEKDVLKLTFKIVDEAGASVQPQQTFLRFYDKLTDEEGISPVSVTSGGKAKFELNMARPPSSLPPTTQSSLTVTLILGSFKHTPTKFDIFELTLPESQATPQDSEAASFQPLPLIHHTFRPDQKMPPKVISLFFSGLTLAPWVVLLGLWFNIKAPTPHLFSVQILPLTACLAAFEALIFWYWVDLKLGQILLYAAILTVPTVFAGKQALVAISGWRLGH